MPESPETALIEAKGLMLAALVNALDNGVSLARCLELLGIEGKVATMVRAFAGRYDERELAGMLKTAIPETRDVELRP